MGPLAKTEREGLCRGNFCNFCNFSLCCCEHCLTQCLWHLLPGCAANPQTWQHKPSLKNILLLTKMSVWPTSGFYITVVDLQYGNADFLAAFGVPVLVSLLTGHPCFLSVKLLRDFFLRFHVQGIGSRSTVVLSRILDATGYILWLICMPALGFRGKLLFIQDEYLKLHLWINFPCWQPRGL